MRTETTSSSGGQSSQSSCLEVAREGERLCRARQFEEGIKKLSRALEMGSEDVRVVSAIHSQLGNAYFALGQLEKAYDHHCHDVTAATIIMQTNGDRVGMAKALGNLSNTLKEMGRFEDAIKVSNQHLKIGGELKSKHIEARAKYTLGSIYMARAKRSPSGVDRDVYTADLEEAKRLFSECLELLEELKDEAGCGRVYGFLGNTHYLLGDLRAAIGFHEKRREVARQFGDKEGERRAYTNLGNAFLLLPEAEKAFEYYELAHDLAKTCGDMIAEAQLAFSLGNTAFLLNDFNRAVDFHNQHLSIARSVKDDAGEVRAHMALAEDHRKRGDLPKALYYLAKARDKARELRDTRMQTITTDMLQKVFEEGGQQLELDASEDPLRTEDDVSKLKKSVARLTNTATPDCGFKRGNAMGESQENGGIEALYSSLMSANSRRYDDQRSEQPAIISSRSRQRVTDHPPPALRSADSKEQLMDQIQRCNERRYNEQRASISLPGLNDKTVLEKAKDLGGRGKAIDDDDELFELIALIMKAQSNRMEDQRSELKNQAKTIEESADPFDFLMRVQGRRMDDQRTDRPPVRALNNNR